MVGKVPPPASIAGDPSKSNTIEALVFCVLFFAAQIALVVLYTFFFTYTSTPDIAASFTSTYGLFRDVNVMIFFGFGFLMTFLRRYGLSAVGYTLVISSLAVQWSPILQAITEFITLHEKVHQIELDITYLLEGLFCAGAVMISYGAILGKATPLQLLIMGILEPIFYWINACLSLYAFEAFDIGGGYTIHMFGCYFGLAVCCWLSPKNAKDHPDETVSYSSDIFSLAGTLFLWICWPSFNAAIGIDDAQKTRAAVNTFLSLTGSTVMTFVVTRFVTGWKFNPVHVQNSTLAGGVAMGIAAHLPIQPATMFAVGMVAGTVSVLGYRYLSPLMARYIRIHDVCGVHNLHGMPSIIGAILGIVGSLFLIVRDNIDPDIMLDGKRQPLHQLIALGITLGVSIVGGALTGGVMWVAQYALTLNREDYFNDLRFWHVASDYDDVVVDPSAAAAGSTDITEEITDDIDTDQM